MADPHRSISYSALPVFSGDFSGHIAMSELAPPPMSGIPRLVPMVRRYASAGAPPPSAAAATMAPRMPKSQSSRVLRAVSGGPASSQGTGVQSSQSSQGAQGTPQAAHARRPQALPSSQSHRDLRPRRQGQPSLRLRPKHVAQGAPGTGSTGGTGSTQSTQTGALGMTRTVSSHHVTGKFGASNPASHPANSSAHSAHSTHSASAANTSGSSIASTASTASTTSTTTLRTLPRSISLKTIPKDSPPRRKPTTAANVPACATVSTAASAAKQISRSDSTRGKRGSARVVRQPLPASTSMNSLRMGRAGVPPSAAQGAGTTAQAPLSTHSTLGPTPSGTLGPHAAAHSTASTATLTTPPKPRRALPRRPPKLDLSRVKADDAQARPEGAAQGTQGRGSAQSSRSSRSSFSEATQRLFGRIRSAASSRSSTRRGTPLESQFPMPPTLLADEWETCPVDPPALEVAAELALLSRAHDSSAAVDESAIKQPQQGLALSKSSTLLTRNERLEILNYATVFYAGKPGVPKQTGNFTDDQGNYRSVLNDHIAYRYEIVAELGKGSFGKVFKATDHKTGRSVALKITCNRAEMRQQARVEARLLQTLRKAGQPDKHHFLRYVSSFTFRDHFCICTEILGDNLYDLLRRNKYKGLGMPLVRYITRQLVEGLEFLDLQGIIHCDLKPENILVSDRDYCQVKIIDFGSGCLEDKRIYTYIQSRFYRAPEILLGIPYTTAIDMWSLGCIVPELLRGKPIFPGEDEADQIAALCETIGTPDQLTLKSCSRSNMFFDNRGALLNRKKRGPPGSRSLPQLLDPMAADFCAKLLQWSPQKRLSAGGALFHEFVLGV